MFTLSKSRRKNKKYMISNGMMDIHFGDSRYEDYTIHKDIKRKKSYLLRHRNTDHNNIRSPAFWSKNLLWNKKTIQSSISDTEKKYNIKIKILYKI